MKHIKEIKKKLAIEKEKLNSLYDKTMNIPLQNNKELLEQSRKVDRLLQEIIKEKSKR